VILAAGEGKRFGGGVCKCLMELNGETIISKLIGQIRNQNIENITVVVGYEKENVIAELDNINGVGINIVHNEIYIEDVNVYSLSMAVSEDDNSFVVFESDLILDDEAVDKIFSLRSEQRSYWFTLGPFRKKQLGGILKSDKSQKVIDIRLVGGYSGEFSDYRKLIGVLMVGRNEFGNYYRFLKEASLSNIRQYYLTPWIENLRHLPCWECSLDEHRAMSFNTPKEFSEALDLFNFQASNSLG